MVGLFLPYTIFGGIVAIMERVVVVVIGRESGVVTWRCKGLFGTSLKTTLKRRWTGNAGRARATSAQTHDATIDAAQIHSIFVVLEG